MNYSETNDDLELYKKAMINGNIFLALEIERKYGLDGYPPSMVTEALWAASLGVDIEDALDRMMLPRIPER